MEGWGRQGGDNTYHEGGRARQPYKKPPLGNWQQTVPSWEKKFCYSVGAVPWRKILETKKCMHLYSNIVNWNDSAGEEAFQNAKNRFYANFHGLPCDMPLPDPNIYIDEIDWNSKIHPDVILDLESGSVPPDADNKNVIIFGSALISSQDFSSAGWGDNEDEAKKATNSTSVNNALNWDSNNGPTEGSEWVDYYAHNNNTWCQTDNSTPKVDSGMNNGWDYEWKNSCDWNQYGNNSYAMNNVNSGGWREVNNGRREGSYMSRYKTSRFHGNDNNRNNNSWRNGRKAIKMNNTTTTGEVGHQWT